MSVDSRLRIISLVFLAGAAFSCGDSSSSPPPPQPAAPAEPATAAPNPKPEPEPEAGSSPRRVRWTEVVIDPAPGPLEKLVKAGAGVYKQQCLVCHGAEGKGDGPAAQVLGTPPRNFTRGQYKFKTSVPDEMPFDEDLYRTISAGISAAGMPSFGDLTPFERWAMVAYVKSLSGFVDTDDGARYNYFELYPAKTKMSLPAPPDKGAIDFARGAHLYREKVQCLKCHGDNGVGDGPSAASLVDADGRTIKPADLTRGEITFKAGDRVEDIYRVLLTGMAGTPMPSFDTLTEEERWTLTFYVTSLYRPIEPGERLFMKTGCLSCHTVGRGKMIGPDLAGTAQRRDREWLRKWLKDPPSMLATDETARQLLAEYLTPMPSYGLSNKEVDLLIQYLEKLPPATGSGKLEKEK